MQTSGELTSDQSEARVDQRLAHDDGGDGAQLPFQVLLAFWQHKRRLRVEGVEFYVRGNVREQALPHRPKTVVGLV